MGEGQGLPLHLVNELVAVLSTHLVHFLVEAKRLLWVGGSLDVARRRLVPAHDEQGGGEGGGQRSQHRAQGRQPAP